VTGKSPFNNVGQVGKLNSPHISLLSIYIPTGSTLDSFLSDKTSFKRFVVLIKDIFINAFQVTTKIAVQLHSQLSNYQILNNWITRAFDDPAHLSSVLSSNYDIFRKQLGFELLNKVKLFPSSMFTSVINTQKALGPHFVPQGQVPPSFTHYSINPKSYPNSEMAISSWFIDWKPHISLAKNVSNPQKFITDIKNVAKRPMSFINLWEVNIKKSIPSIAQDIYGSLEYIYCSYDSGANQQFIYEKI